MTGTTLNVTDLINLLFEHVRKEDGSTYNTPEAAELTGVKESTLRALRNGVIANPKLATLITLVRFFKVSLDYFESETEQEALAIIARSRGTLPQLQDWAFRFGQLPAAAQADIWRLVEWIEEAIRRV